MLRIIAKSPTLNNFLKRNEAIFLYEGLNSFGFHNLLSTAQKMFSRESFDFKNKNNWDSFEDFHKFLSYFSELANSTKLEPFVFLLTELDSEEEGTQYFTLPDIINLDKLRAEARAMIQFLEAVADFQDYEVMLNSLGYGLDSNNNAGQAVKRNKKKINE